MKFKDFPIERNEVNPLYEVIKIPKVIFSTHVLDKIIYKDNLCLKIIMPSLKNDEELEGYSFPVIVFTQGSGWKKQNIDSNICSLGKIVEKGFIVVDVEYTGSEISKFPQSIIDVEDAIRWTYNNIKKYHGDNSKIFLWGNSSGGHVMSYIGVTFKEINIKGIIDFYGPIELSSLDIGASNLDHKTNQSIGSLYLGYNPIENKEKAKEASVIAQIHDNKIPPFLIIHGNKDRKVPFKQSELLAETLKKYHCDYEFYCVEDADHGGSGIWNDIILNKCLNYLNKLI